MYQVFLCIKLCVKRLFSKHIVYIAFLGIRITNILETVLTIDTMYNQTVRLCLDNSLSYVFKNSCCVLVTVYNFYRASAY